MTPPVTGPVLVVGSGLLGASIGLALRRAGVQVWLDDVDPHAVAEAVGRGAGEPWRPDAGEPRLVVVAVPPAVAGAAMARAGSCREVLAESLGPAQVDVLHLGARQVALGVREHPHHPRQGAAHVELLGADEWYVGQPERTR